MEARHGIRILVIDDDVLDRELTVRSLTRLACPPGPAEVVTAGDWNEAVPHLEAGGFDLMLLDYNLPQRSGLEILHALEHVVHPPVIMTTGQNDISTAVETLRAGAHDYVAKATDWGPALCLAVERVLARAALEREVAEARVALASHAAELEQKVAARTEMLRAQAAEIEALYLKAESAGRVKSEILNNVSHELRTPLNVMTGYVEMLQRGITAGAASSDELFAKLRGQIAHLDRLVGSLLTLNRLEADAEVVEVSRFSLADLVGEFHAEVNALNADRGLAITWGVPTGEHLVAHDRAKVRAIAYHLLSNAIKFTPRGQVDVSAAVRADGGVVLTVRDTGIGLPAEAESVAFEDFRQVDGSSTRRHGGLGLGLGIVKRYTELLGGTIRLARNPDGGTTVVVDLPPPRKRGLDRAPQVAVIPEP